MLLLPFGAWWSAILVWIQLGTEGGRQRGRPPEWWSRQLKGCLELTHSWLQGLSGNLALLPDFCKATTAALCLLTWLPSWTCRPKQANPTKMVTGRWKRRHSCGQSPSSRSGRTSCVAGRVHKGRVLAQNQVTSLRRMPVQMVQQHSGRVDCVRLRHPRLQSQRGLAKQSQGDCLC